MAELHACGAAALAGAAKPAAAQIPSVGETLCFVPSVAYDCEGVAASSRL